MPSRKLPPGVRERHGRTCAVKETGKCLCAPSYEAWVFDRRSGQKIRKTFPTLGAAKSWRSDAVGAVRRGLLKPASPVTLREAAAGWLEGATTGVIRNRSGRPYKPAALRNYRSALDAHVLPELGARRIGDVRRIDVQDLVERLVAGKPAGKGLGPSAVRNVVMPLRVIYRRALIRGDVTINPTRDHELPAVEGRRERIATPEEAPRLLAALPEGDRALWATALYGGLRLGELRGLEVADTDVKAGIIHVRRSWDAQAGPVEPKSRKGTRTVPIPGALRGYLAGHLLRLGWADGLVFGRSAREPFVISSVYRRAFDAWETAELEPIRLHECRHTYVSLMHDAGLSLERIGDYVGHSSTYMTDRYRHLLEGHEAEAAERLDMYLLNRTGARSGAHPAQGRL